MYIVFVGGGTGGSVSPLLAIINQLRKRLPSCTVAWFGTHHGPERIMTRGRVDRYVWIANGKLRRYMSWQNLIDPFFIFFGFVQSLALLIIHRPHWIVVAGSFVGVPVVWAAWLLRIPVLIHQQDVTLGLATRLMAPVARYITASLPVPYRGMGMQRVRVTGNPVREDLRQIPIDQARTILGITDTLPIIMVVGGGTGAHALNTVTVDALPFLVEHCWVVHITGGRDIARKDHARHIVIPFATDTLGAILSAADVVVTRAGMSMLSELAIFGKPALVIPMPDSHQVANAEYFVAQGAALMLDQRQLSPEAFSAAILDLLHDKPRQAAYAHAMLSIAMPDAAERIASILIQQ